MAMDDRARDLDLLTELLADHARAEAADGEAAAGDLEPEEMLAFLEGRLEPAAAARLERRLVADPEAARSLLDLADFAAAEASAGDTPREIATHAGWRDFQERLGKPAAPARRTPPFLIALAAGLFVAVVALAGWVWTLSGAGPAGLAGPAGPAVLGNLASLELGAGLRSDDLATAAVAPGAPVRLVVAPLERCPEYTAEIRREGSGGAAWSHTESGLVRDRLGLVTLLLSAGPGNYELTLTGCEPPRALESHRFRIVPPGATGAEGDGG